jgi:hypothetical protein
VQADEPGRPSVTTLIDRLARRGNDGDEDVAKLVAWGPAAVEPLLQAADPNADRVPQRRQYAAAALADINDERGAEAVQRLLAIDAQRTQPSANELDELAYLCGVAGYLGNRQAMPALVAIMPRPELARVAAGAVAYLAGNVFGVPPQWQVLYLSNPDKADSVN